MPKNTGKTVILAYMPVLHQGYRQFLGRHERVDELLILGPDIIATFDHLARKDIRALAPEQVVAALQSWSLPFSVREVGLADLPALNTPDFTVIIAAEDELQTLVAEHLPLAQLVQDHQFLRWTHSRAIAHQELDTVPTVGLSALEQEFLQQAQEIGAHSSDWWRQIGAVIARDGEVLLAAYNHHLPHPQQPYVDGDARGLFHKGEHIELTTAIHAEASLIATAARRGLSLEGASLYVTTFPCPTCAKLVAATGINKLYFAEGYAMLDGKTILERAGVKIQKAVIENNSR